MCVNSRLYCMHFLCHWHKICNILHWLTQISKRQLTWQWLYGNVYTLYFIFYNGQFYLGGNVSTPGSQLIFLYVLLWFNPCLQCFGDHYYFILQWQNNQLVTVTSYWKWKKKNGDSRNVLCRSECYTVTLVTLCRSFGRAPRSVQLEGSFVPYDADILPEEDTRTLVSRPYFHIYWTDCVSGQSELKWDTDCMSSEWVTSNNCVLYCVSGQTELKWDSWP